MYFGCRGDASELRALLVEADRSKACNSNEIISRTSEELPYLIHSLITIVILDPVLMGPLEIDLFDLSVLS